MPRLGRRFHMDRAHVEHVAALCDRLFVELPHLHGLTKTSRGLVEAAGLLHDIDEAGGKARHDVSGARRIRSIRIPGLSAAWQELVAQAVSLHSKGSDVAGFLARLAKGEDPTLELTGRVAAILRVADGLDHARQQDTRIAAILDDGQAVEILLAPSPGAEENARFAMLKADLWNRLALRPIRQIAVAAGVVPRAELVSPSQPARVAARRILQRQIEQFASRQYGAACHADAEYIHEMRVAIRRLRSAGEALGKLLGAPLKKASDKLCVLAGPLGKVRDTDVFLEYLQDYARQAPPAHRRTLRALALGRRRGLLAERRELEAGLARPGVRQTLSRLRRELASGAGAPSPGAAPSRRRGRAALPAWREARRSLLRHLDDVLSHGRRLKKLSPRKQHLLRIDCKRLRYLAEFFQSFYGRSFQDLIRTTVQLQDLLGTIHDSYVYADWLQEATRRLPGEGGEAALALLDHLRRQREESLDKAGPVWRSFTGRRSRKRLMRIIRSPRKN
jgi:CHAD domain-containing protein